MNTSSSLSFGIDRDYLLRCKNSTPEQRITWLFNAQELAYEAKKMRENMKQKNSDQS